MDIATQIQECSDAFYQALAQAQTQEHLENVRVMYLGRKGKINQLTKTLQTLPEEERRIYGPRIKQLKNDAHNAFHEKYETIHKQEATKNKPSVDVTAYTPAHVHGSLHPYTHITQEIENIFSAMGFDIVFAPEVETSYYNFETLNIPENHPARDLHDTFWLDIPGLLLRTHTSTVQGHIMEQQEPPIAVVAPGRAYRHEATDASHDIMFMQCEGLLIDHNISLSHLFATMKAMLQALFKHHELEMRVRPGYFPFVEPGVEIDISCPFCSTGCSTCKRTRWIEICGAGLVHPNVLQTSNVDPTVYSGFAFGFGLTRLAMLKYNINDIRLLHSSNVRFLKQFP